MIQFKIGVQVIDLPQKTTVQLLRKNEIFSFDSMEVERSVSFDIPATPNNNAILGISSDYHTSGMSMRVKIAATMEIGVVTREGYLCISAYDYKNNAYKAIFLFGQLLGLQLLRNADKFNKMGLQTDEYIDVNSTIYDAPNAIDKIWARVKYNTSNPNGSISVRLLFDLLSQREDLPRVNLPQGVDGLRIIKYEQKGYEYEKRLKSIVNSEGGRQPSTEYPEQPYNLCEYDPTLFEAANDYFGYYSTFSGGGVQQYYNIQGLRVLTPLSITFPSEMSDKWFLQNAAETYGDADNFYGDHWWQQLAPNTTPTIHGASLAGKTIDFNAGDVFYLVNVDDYVYTSGGDLTVEGWRFSLDNNTFPYDFKITVEGFERLFLRDNLPDFTPIELCKIIAGLTGTVLRYDEGRGVWFDELKQEDWVVKDLEGVIAREEMERRFGGYAQRNYVRFDDPDNPQSLVTVYTVDNENLQEENDLQVMPLASGIVGTRSYYSALTIAGDKDTLADTHADNKYLQRVTLNKNDEIQGFCTQSTSLKLSCLQNVLQYVGITPRTLFFFDGALWAWVQMQWADDKVQLVLAQKGVTTK